MHRPIAYLAGGIAGLPGRAARDWRYEAYLRLSERYIETLDPMRAKGALPTGEQPITRDFQSYAKNGPFYTSRGIMARDFNDVKRCAALLVNLLGLTKPSLGTVMELGWAYALQKPAVVAIEAEGNPHDGHPMIHEAMPFRVTTLDEAIDAVATILNR